MTNYRFEELCKVKEDPTLEPKPDIAICSECGWRGDISECGTDKEGDWESGYYDVHICPKCVDGGCIDDYDMSPSVEIDWWLWDIKYNGIFPWVSTNDKKPTIGKRVYARIQHDLSGDIDHSILIYSGDEIWYSKLPQCMRKRKNNGRTFRINEADFTVISWREMEWL